MKVRLLSIALVTLWLPVTATAGIDPLCSPLRDFVRSVHPGETKVLEFHTSWGGNFKDSPAPVIFAKRCNHYGYGPAEAVCAHLMEHGAIEFSDNNLKSAVMCLSPKTRMAPSLSLNSAEISLTYGSSQVNLEFGEDPQIGGMVLRVAADGY